MRRTFHRADRDHFKILAALKKITFVVDTHHHSGGVGDILARHVVTGEPVFLEVKSSAKDKLTLTEAAFATWFPRHWKRVNNIDEALAAVTK